MSETFTFDVSYSTTFEDLEKLRDRMLAFVKAERRDFLAEFDVKVKGQCFDFLIYEQLMNSYVIQTSLSKEV
jgi:small-conductance mechanosensitive channel